MFSKSGRKNICHPTYSSAMWPCHSRQEAEANFPRLKSEWALLARMQSTRQSSNAVRLPRDKDRSLQLPLGSPAMFALWTLPLWVFPCRAQVPRGEKAEPVEERHRGAKPLSHSSLGPRHVSEEVSRWFQHPDPYSHSSLYVPSQLRPHTLWNRDRPSQYSLL